MTSEKQKKAKPAERQSVSQNFDLSQLESLRLSFTDMQGNQMLVIELDRQTEQSPQLKLSRYENGDLKSSHTIYDVDA